MLMLSHILVIIYSALYDGLQCKHFLTVAVVSILGVCEDILEGGVQIFGISSQCKSVASCSLCCF
jgi:hypothetical protein